MNKSYSILIHPENETKVRRFGVSHLAIRAVVSTVVVLAAIATWIFGDYVWMKVQNRKHNNVEAQLAAEVQTLKTRHHEEVILLRNHVQTQQNKLLTIQQQINASQQLLADWKDLRTKIKASMPRQRRASLEGQHVVETLKKSLLSLQGELENLIASIPSEWPTKGWLSSNFGMRESPWTKKREFHSGVDIANRTGTPVQAPGAAVVHRVGHSGANGKHIILDHGQGITTHYGHLSKIKVKKGERVDKNQTIGNIGSTGRSTNPHLHYEVHINGIPVNPRRKLLNGNPPMS
jgi:murein DD-endopeptidase MepM/ murein hydrolase activator NlpD